MATGKFDRFMVDVGVGRNLKVGRLTPSERWTFVAGVLGIAATSPARGVLMVGASSATVEDVAKAASVTKSVAESTLRKLRELGMLEVDTDSGFEQVHDWDDYQVAPTRLDNTATRRKQLQRDGALRQAIRDRDGDRCRYCGREVVWTDRRSPQGGTYDHVDPEVGNSIENLVVACRGCNSAKRDRTPEDAGMPLLGPGFKPRTKSGFDPDLTEVEGEVEVEDTSSLRSDGAPVDDDLPERLPEPLHVTARHVHDRLCALATAKRGSVKPTLSRVGGIVADFPEHDHRGIVADVVDYWQHGGGAKTVRKDLGRVYLDKCKREVARPHLRTTATAPPSSDDQYAVLRAKREAQQRRATEMWGEGA